MKKEFTFLDKVRATSRAFPDVVAFRNSANETITYGELEQCSDAFASYLIDEVVQNNDYPAFRTQTRSTSRSRSSFKVVALRGHKQPTMLVGMLACMKAGICYVPLESSLPPERVKNILSQLRDPLLIEVEEGSCASLEAQNVLIAADFCGLLQQGYPPIDQSFALSLDDPHYILFTSGSTGDPKGVVQTARTMESICHYFEHFIPKTDEEHKVFFNKTHFSFDMSLFDLAIALPFGHTMFALEEEAEASLPKTFEALSKSHASLWISTPSYLNMCLADPSFDRSLMPQLDTVVVAGETLFKSTAKKLFERFDQVRLINSYGPTETQAVTDVEITPALIEENETLPIGACSPFNQIQIVDHNTKETLGTNIYGEICILGDSVADGYFERPDLTEKSFTHRIDTNDIERPAYFTGDKGLLDDLGMLWFSGRFDDQVSLNGFRVELQEVEIAFNELADVVESCVTFVDKGVMSSYLVAHVVLSNEVEKGRSTTRYLKDQLKEKLPHYMIPRLIKYYDELPKSVNGKIDRKKLSLTSSTSHQESHPQ